MRYVYAVSFRIVRDRSRSFREYFSSLKKAKEAVAGRFMIEDKEVHLEWDKNDTAPPSNIFFTLLRNGEEIDMRDFGRQKNWHVYPNVIKKYRLH